MVATIAVRYYCGYNRSTIQSDTRAMVKTLYKVTLYHGGERPTQTKYAYSQEDADFLATTAEHAIIQEINYEK